MWGKPMRLHPRLTGAPAIAAALLLLMVLTSCFPPRTTPIEDRIRQYLFKGQPTTGQQFVDWANQEFAGYAAQQILDALRSEGRFQAQLGHPNAVGVLSFAAQAWAQRKGLLYDVREWLALQEEATKNLRDEPGDLQLWPTPGL